MSSKPLHAEDDPRIAKLAARLRRKNRWKRKEGSAAVNFLKQSGLSRAAFGKQYDLPAHRLKYWSDKIAPEADSAVQDVTPVLALHPVKLSQPVIASNPKTMSGTSEVEIVTPADLRIRLGPDFCAETLRKVLEIIAC